MKKHIKLFSHTDLDGYGCNLILELLPVTYKATNLNHDTVNNVVKEYILSKEYKNYNLTIITDISVNEEVAELCNNTKDLKILLLDHHSTALWLNKYNWAEVRIKNKIEKTCGTEILFEEFKEDIEKFISNKTIMTNIESLVRAIKRYDTWLWKEKYNDVISKQVNDLFYILGYERFKVAIKDNLYDIINLIKEYELFLILQQEKIDRYIESKNDKIISYKFNNLKFGVVFAEQFVSELGNRLSEMNPQYDLIAIIGSNGINYRTTKDNIDCSKIAKILGGGGHPKASGSEISETDKVEYLKLLFR